MRCQEARRLMAARRDGDLSLTASDASALQEHLKDCSQCRIYEQHLQLLQTSLLSPAYRVHSSISTERIMRAVQQRERITRQLEDIRAQQQTRMARMGKVAIPLVALLVFIVGSVPLLLLALFIIQPDLLDTLLLTLGNVVFGLIILGQYVQAALALVTGDSRLLAIVALGLVVMMGMWLRLMRPPQEA